jgi:hypothetical protein
MEERHKLRADALRMQRSGSKSKLDGINCARLASAHVALTAIPGVTYAKAASDLQGACWAQIGSFEQSALIRSGRV